MNDTRTRGDVRIAGAGSVATGAYETVSVSGSATLTGDVECDALKVSGAADGRGTLKAGRIVVNGSLTYRGDADAQEVRVNGTATFGKLLRAGTLKVAGTVDVDGDLHATEVHSQGYVRVSGDCEAERLKVEGGLTVGGLLNAGVIDITLYAKCDVRDIGGEAVLVKSGRSGLHRLIAMLVPLAERRLTAESIEGDDVRLEQTTARVVRGKSVVLGPGCVVDLVEYTESYSAAPDAKVKEARKAGGAEENR
jgi:cytoskeletal protein CcmA (bactofilin family)